MSIVSIATSLLGVLWAAEAEVVEAPATTPRKQRHLEYTEYTYHRPAWPVLPTGGVGYDSLLGLGGELGLFYTWQERRYIMGHGWVGLEALFEIYDQARGISAGYAVKEFSIAGLMGYSLRAGYLRNDDPNRLAPDEQDYLSLIADGSFMIPTIRLRLTVAPAFDHATFSAGAFLKF